MRSLCATVRNVCATIVIVPPVPLTQETGVQLMSEHERRSLVQCLPQPQAVREQIAENRSEYDLLNRLLRLVEFAAKRTARPLRNNVSRESEASHA